MDEIFASNFKKSRNYMLFLAYVMIVIIYDFIFLGSKIFTELKILNIDISKYKILILFSIIILHLLMMLSHFLKFSSENYLELKFQDDAVKFKDQLSEIFKNIDEAAKSTHIQLKAANDLRFDIKKNIKELNDISEKINKFYSDVLDPWLREIKTVIDASYIAEERLQLMINFVERAKNIEFTSVASSEELEITEGSLKSALIFITKASSAYSEVQHYTIPDRIRV